MLNLNILYVELKIKFTMNKIHYLVYNDFFFYFHQKPATNVSVLLINI